MCGGEKEERIVPSDIFGILSELGFHFMAMAAGVFAIVGTLLAASGKAYRRTRVLVWALALYTLSAIVGYFFEGLLVSALHANKPNPFDSKIVICGFLQLVLFLAASSLLIWFYVANIDANRKCPEVHVKENGSEDH